MQIPIFLVLCIKSNLKGTANEQKRIFVVLGVDTGIQLGIAAPLLPQSGNTKKGQS